MTPIYDRAQRPRPKQLSRKGEGVFFGSGEMKSAYSRCRKNASNSATP